ncbi:MAG TPA: glutamate-cysteine ligase family protein [Candidatus Krumholzibacteria bacterium]|nr:glutamate-cysteine ligase family protein [Candidatus Krumholzibacteria bacterium]
MTLSLFAGYGIELEYMLVDDETLDVLPVADALLQDGAAGVVSELEQGETAWSNELVLHLLELKTNGPVARLEGVAALFQRDLARLRQRLRPLGGRLMPTGMHPWMRPRRETRLWPHDDAQVYAAFDRIFDCRNHGWANVQSLHLNLPFAGDAEFARLHAAVRLVLPLLPALAASSPFVEGRLPGVLDARLAAYATNCARLPSVTGAVVPEPVFTQATYETEILGPIARDLAPHDPERILAPEWVNARGAIPRFSRSALEIRLLDMQECPQADLACAALVSAAVRALVEERWVGLETQKSFSTEPLARLLQVTVQDGERARLEDRGFLAAFGMSGGAHTARDVWRHLAKALATPAEFERPLAVLLEEGPLARRLLAAAGPEPTRGELKSLYERLCDCLDRGQMFA